MIDFLSFLTSVSCDDDNENFFFYLFIIHDVAVFFSFLQRSVFKNIDVLQLISQTHSHTCDKAVNIQFHIVT